MPLALASGTRAKLDASGPGSSDLLDPLVLYLRDAGDSRGLPAEEERALGAAIARGREAQARLEEGAVTSPERQELLRVVEAGRQARQRLTESNLRLVLHVAARFRSSGLPLADLVQEGNIGLMQAVDRFDYRRGFRFSTYAVWWIRQAMQRALSNTSRTIRMPVHAVQLAWKIDEAQATLEQQLGRTPTIEEVAAALDRTPAEVRRLRRASQPPLSLSLHPHEDGTEELAETVMDEEGVDPSDAAAQGAWQADVDRLLELLTPRERAVVRARFGFTDGVPRSLGEIGTALGISREAARQAEDRALKRLRRRTDQDRAALREYLLN